MPCLPVILATSIRHPSRAAGGMSQRATIESGPSYSRRRSSGLRWSNFGSDGKSNHWTPCRSCVEGAYKSGSTRQFLVSVRRNCTRARDESHSMAGPSRPPYCRTMRTRAAPRAFSYLMWGCLALVGIGLILGIVSGVTTGRWQTAALGLAGGIAMLCSPPFISRVSEYHRRLLQLAGGFVVLTCAVVLTMSASGFAVVGGVCILLLGGTILGQAAFPSLMRQTRAK